MPSAHLRLLVFISGLAVMAVEMTGLRLLAPFFGTSLIVTTVLIGSMMGFLALGYHLGGRYGDRHPRLSALGWVTGAAALLILLIPFAGQPVLRLTSQVMRTALDGGMGGQVAGSTIATVVGGVLGTLALFAVPVTLMGMVSPWAIRLAVDDVDRAGQAAGRLYALSTTGSIVGSFLPALVLIPVLGVRNTFVLVGLCLLLVSAPAVWKGWRGTAAPAALVPLLFLPQGIIRPMPGLVEEQESLYHFIQVVVEPFGKCEKAYHLYLNEGVGVHSVKCLDPSVETRGYWAFTALAPYFMETPPQDPDVLIIGLAGGTMARQVLEMFPQARIDGVEIDASVYEVGRKWFDNADPRVTGTVMDGRIFLNSTDKRWDVILVDAYRQPYVPFHLTTLEFWSLLAEHLAPGGVVSVNVASVRGASPVLLQMMYRTLREVFPSVHRIQAGLSNDVLVATAHASSPNTLLQNLAPLPGSSLMDQVRTGLPKRLSTEVEGWQDARILLDDQAPVEVAWELMALEYAR